VSRVQKYLFFVGFDALFIAAAFYLTALFRGHNLAEFIVDYRTPIAVFSAVWLIGSLLGRKFQLKREMSMNEATIAVFRTNVILLLVVTAIILYGGIDYSRVVLIGAMVFTTAFELLATYVYTLDRELTAASRLRDTMREKPRLDFESEVERSVQEWRIDEGLHASIVDEAGEAAFSFIRLHLGDHPGQTLFISTTTRFNILAQPMDVYRNIVNLHRINDIQYVNKFFESINERLPAGGVFINCVETQEQRKKRLLEKYPPMFNYLYYPLDYVFKRVFPKLAFTKGIYFLLTRGNNRVMSRAETLGRLYSCGFELLGDTASNGRMYFAARKIKEPAFDKSPTYGPLVKLNRIGKDGKLIGVYKMRTMYPFAEYLQEYIHQNQGLDAGGKFNDDFRITTLGRFMRKLWLDEFPMFLNVFKGEMKIVGVRPLSRHYYSLYDEDLKQRRIKYRPGLVPPFYADMPKTLEEIMDSERRYLDAYEKSPWRTDTVYLWKAMVNIFFRNARSG